MFSPSTIAQAIPNGIHPMLNMMSVMAMVAEDDCNTRVKIVPKARNNNTEPKPCADQVLTNSNTSGVCLRSGTDSFMNESPRNKRLKPTISSPMFLRWFFFELEKRKPNSINGMARIEISALKPKNATIQAVMVVPILAPIITPMACTKVRSPALTKLTTITVVADEDWITAVIPTPVNTPFNGLDVIADKNPRNLSPAAFCRPELIKFIPYRNIPNAPNNVNTCNIPIVFSLSSCKEREKMFHKCFKRVKLRIKMGD